jgi:hypothetical protein
LSENPLQSLLQQGIAAAKAGDKVRARQLLESVLITDDRNELAWIWLASVVGTVRERRICLEKVLQINPRNERARQALNQLVSAVDAEKPSSAALNPEALAQRPRSAGRRLLSLLAVVAAVLVVLSVLSILFSPRVEIAVPPTSTPLSAQALAAIISPTPVPSPTPNIQLVTPIPRTLPPTFTPTFTPSPTATLFPTRTPFPDAQYTLLYVSRELTAPLPALYQIAGDGSGERKILDNVLDFAFDPIGETVVMVRSTSGGGSPEATAEPDAGETSELFLAPASDLANARQITRLGNASAYTPRFSPDGRQIVFVSDFSGSDDLYLYDIASGLTTRLTDSPAIDRDPVWIPNSQQIVFVSDRDSPLYTDLYVLRFVGDGETAITRLTDHSGSSYSPAVSPSGRQIAYINDGDLYVMSSSGQRQSALVVGPSEERLPAWSADGRYIAFVSNRVGDLFQVYLVEPPDRTVKPLTADGREAGAVQFRPDLIFRVVGQEN